MLYSTLKFIHIASMAFWIGGVFTMLILNRILTAAGDRTTLQGLGRLGGAVSMRVFMPAMLVTVITGIGMVQVGELSFGTTWVAWGIVGVVVSFVLGGVLTGGTARKLGQQIASGQVTPEQIAATQRRILTYAVLNLVLLLSIIWAMVAKPA
jgi:uncharacterized membrane protein